MKWPSLMLSAAALGLAVAARTSARNSFDGRCVLITGGSRGLGLVLARELVTRGASVGLLARNALELERARRTIVGNGSVLLLPADVTDRVQVRQAIALFVRRFGRLDAVVNNAGVIVSAPLADTTADDIRALMEVHLFGTLNVTQAALPHLARVEGARVINVCSIGGKIGVPHLSAYCASKFAQAGLSAVMSQELRSRGVRVTTVHPGLMRTGSHVNAWFKGERRVEFAAFSLVNGLPGSSMSAERAARQIINAAERGVADIVIPFTIRQVARVAALAPNAVSIALAAVNQMLPSRPSEFAVQGKHVGLSPALRAVVSLSERAADRNNER